MLPRLPLFISAVQTIRINYQVVYSYYYAETERLLEAMWSRFSKQWKHASVPEQIHQGLFFMWVLGMFSTCGIPVSKKREEIQGKLVSSVQEKLVSSVQEKLSEAMIVVGSENAGSLDLAVNSSNRPIQINLQALIRQQHETVERIGSTFIGAMRGVAEIMRLTQKQVYSIQETVDSLKDPIDSAVSMLEKQNYEANRKKIFSLIKVWVVLCFGAFLLSECLDIIDHFSDYSEDLWLFAKELFLYAWRWLESWLDRIFTTKWYGTNVKKWMAVAVIAASLFHYIGDIFRLLLSFIFSHIHWVLVGATLLVQYGLVEYSRLLRSTTILICILVYYQWVPKYKYYYPLTLGITVVIFYYYLFK